MIEDLIRTLIRSDLRVGNLHANVDTLLLGIALHAVQYRDCVIGAFLLRHAPPFPGDRDKNGAPSAPTHMSIPGIISLFNLIVDILADQSILEAGSRTSRIIPGIKPFCVRIGTCARDGGQIYALEETNARENLAPLLERGRRVARSKQKPSRFA